MEILRRQGITQAFGLPGAAINPFYRTMRDEGEISRTLARHVAGAQFLHTFHARSWINCGQAGPLGWTLPAALGVATADPSAIVVALPVTTTSSS